ncbi:MAG: PAS domain-containing protein [Acidobacteria bacterium]|nr:PAS domain-containing protein [Acidobacteriota bacterium]
MLIRRIAFMLVTAFALVVAAVSMARTIRSFHVLDFQATWTADALRLDVVPRDSSARRAGLQPGDRIVSIDGTPVAELTNPGQKLTWGNVHRLEILRPGTGTITVAFHPPPPEVDPVYLARSVVAIAGIICALLAVLGTARDEAATMLLLALAALVLATIPHRTAASSVLFAMLHRASGAALSFLLVRFFAIFPEQRKVPLFWDLATGAAMGLAAATAVIPGTATLWPSVAIGLRAAFVAALVAGSVLQIRKWRASARVARIRRQIEWSALGMFTGLFPYGALVLLPRWLGIGFEPFSWLAVVPVMAVPIGFLAALKEYRLWDLEPITRDTLSAILVVTLGGLVFAALNRLLFTSVAQAGPLRSLLAFATGVILVMILHPVRQQVGTFLDQWLYHGRPAPRRLITNATRELAQTTDPVQLLKRLSSVLHDDLELELVATYQRFRGNDFRRVTPAVGDLPASIPGAIVGTAYPATAEQPLRDEGFALRIPLERAGVVQGLLYLGLRRGIFPLGREVREVVAALAAQAALGLESAGLMEDLRQQAEEYRILHANTQRIIESSAAGILVCDARGRILSANTQAAGVFSIAASELVGRELGTLVELPKQWAPQLPVHVLNAGGQTLTEPPRWIVMAVSALELESGRFDGRVVVLQDVTELRELENRVREQERLASLGRLASGLAHEINTPLTGIASFAQLLGEMTPREDPRAGIVAKLVDQSFRVSRIVANLHEAMRGSGGQPALLDLGQAVRRAAEDAARSLGAEGRIRIADPAQPVLVHAFSGAVELAVGNLVRNAIEASPPAAKVEITIGGDDEAAWIQVRDHGPGVPHELREKIFEPFFTTRSATGGTGLGLAITRDMISRQGGEVRLEPAPPRGTRAVIRLPRSRSPHVS